MKSWVRAGFLSLVLAAVAVFAAPAPSMAASDDFNIQCDAAWASCQTGVKVASFEGHCDIASATYYAGTIVCVKYAGDYVYVYDNDADGYAAVGEIDSELGIAVRLCRNNHGHGTWARCNFDWSESGTKDVYGGYLIGTVTMPEGYLWSFSGN